MDKIPLLLAASHTVARKACQKTFAGGRALASGFASAISMGLSALIALLVLTLTMGGIFFPATVASELSRSACEMCRAHQGFFFHGDSLTAMGIMAYAGTICAAYAAAMALIVRSKRDHPLVQQIPAGWRRTIMLAFIGVGFFGEAFFNQLLWAPMFGREGRLMATFNHGWKLILWGIALPIHIAGLLALLATGLLDEIKAQAAAKAATLPAPAYPRPSALERLARESPEILARMEAKALKRSAKAARPAPPSARL